MHEPQKPKIYSTEEIDFFLSGDRRDVDRLLLHGLNALAALMLPHTDSEARLVADLGGAEQMKKRARWIDAQIELQTKRIKMIDKVNESAVIWALLAFAGFCFYALRDSIVAFLKGS